MHNQQSTTKGLKIRVLMTNASPIKLKMELPRQLKHVTFAAVAQVRDGRQPEVTQCHHDY